MNSFKQLLKPDAGKLRQFAWGWLVFFGALGLVRYLRHAQTMAALIFAAVALLGFGMHRVFPGLFRRIYILWMILAFPIGWTVSQIALLSMFYGLITPVALWFRLIGRDRLRRRQPIGVGSYWIKKEPTTDVSRYFRPY